MLKIPGVWLPPYIGAPRTGWNYGFRPCPTEATLFKAPFLTLSFAFVLLKP
ncbi:hypothetical protein [Dulcicalothrix desertica]|uniref:hypothetical protein n=1 Tax=Dulcicalothrix desertica TaxID=32056 RepID=UPI00131527E9|nr:hypothetical protein [Dulcicalothrix desertica]